MSEALDIWVVYDHPTDYPNQWIARRWEVTSTGVTKATGDLLADWTLEGLRESIRQVHPGSTCIARHQNDDPKIAESWI